MAKRTKPEDGHEPSLRNRLASYAHEAWSGWMRYLFEKSIKNTDGTVTIPVWAATRWERRFQTPYDELLEDEMASDLKEADCMLGIIGTERIRELEAQIKAMNETQGGYVYTWEQENAKLRNELAEIEAATVPSGRYLDVVARYDKLRGELERRKLRWRMTEITEMGFYLRWLKTSKRMELIHIENAEAADHISSNFKWAGPIEVSEEE